MEDKCVVSTQESVCAISPPGPQLPRASRDGQYAEQEHHKKSLPHVEPFYAGGFIIAKCAQNGVDY